MFTRSKLALAMLALPVAVSAQDNGNVLEEVLVTARKQSETLQDVPFSIAAMTEGKLKQSGATDLESMATNVAPQGFRREVAVRDLDSGIGRHGVAS